MKKEQYSNKKSKTKVNKRNKNNYLKAFKNIFLFTIILVLLYNNIYLFTNNKKTKNIFGIKIHLIEDNMMADYLKLNDIAVIKTKINKFKIDDVVLFEDLSGIKIERIHNIIESDYLNKDKTFIMKADKSFYLNNYEVKEENIIGKVFFRIPKSAFVFRILRSRILTIVSIAILSILLFLLIQIRIYRPNRSRGRKEEAFLQQVIRLFSKEKAKPGRHSRKIQKEKIRRKHEERDISKK